MLDKKGFNAWSGDYDDNIVKMQNTYPFDGYYNMFGQIEKEVLKKENPKVLDLGIGTGTLSKQLEKNGAIITGVDFSNRMLMIAKEKLNEGTFYQQDLTEGLPIELSNVKYDYIVSTFALHHIPNNLKKMYFKHVMAHLDKEGVFIIGDVSFENKLGYDLCKKENIYTWDYDEAEHYFIQDVFKEYLENNFKVTYDQVSSCAGLLILKHKS